MPTSVVHLAVCFNYLLNVFGIEISCECEVAGSSTRKAPTHRVFSFGVDGIFTASSLMTSVHNRQRILELNSLIRRNDRSQLGSSCGHGPLERSLGVNGEL